MELFLRLETHSNILGSKDKNVTYIATSQIISIRSDANGGSTVNYGAGQEAHVPDLSPDHLMTNCVKSIAPEGFIQDLNVVVNN